LTPPMAHGFGPRPSSPVLDRTTSTITGIIVDPHWSRRTFKIPDCPAKNTVGSLKEWYTRNICPNVHQSKLEIVRQDTGALVDDECPFWQLAEGESVFTISVLHVNPPAPAVDEASITLAQSVITLYVQHDTSGISTSVELPLNSTLLQLKIAAFDKLCLGDALAALNPNVGCTFAGLPLDNEASIGSSHLSHGDHIYIGERRSPPVSRRASRTPSPTSEDRMAGYQSIADIWSGSDSHSDDEGLFSTEDSVPLCLPSSLLDDDEPAEQRPQRRRNSDPKTSSRPSRKHQTEIERTKQSYRTKMCRKSGFGQCKFGHKCWFAHTSEELRKPCDPLPPQCPGANKLEKYARRADN